MRSKAFRKHGVFVKDWIYKQLVTTVEPVHPDLPSLIEEYVQAILVSPLSTSTHAKSRGATIVQVGVVRVWPQNSHTDIVDYEINFSSDTILCRRGFKGF